jgi:putative FmdB family regulatory protein
MRGREVFPFQFSHRRYQTVVLSRTRWRGFVLFRSTPVRSQPAGKYRERTWLTSQFHNPRYLRAEIAAWGSWSRTTINAVPIYEFVCESCGHRFEELVGSHVGREAGDVACPECGSAKVERQISGGYATTPHQLTPNQKRRLEERRGTDRGGARERFGRQRAAERAAAKRRGNR